jgi:hypothetical protein
VAAVFRIADYVAAAMAACGLAVALVAVVNLYKSF